MVASITTVPLPTQLGGRVVAYETSEVRPQVNGLVRARYFQEGSVVRKGQPLYRIDPSLYEAAVNQAQANVTSAQATAEAARVKANRYRPLAEMEAVSKQEYTDAAAQARQAQAGVAQNRAALRTAQINLHLHQHSRADHRPDRTVARHRGRAGDGKPGRSAGGDHPARSDLCRYPAIGGGPDPLRRALATGGVTAGSTQVRLKLDDGSDYGFTGTVEFAEIIVNRKHRNRHAPRPIPQSARHAAAGNVRPGALHPGDRAQRVPGAAAGDQARHRRRSLCLHRRAGQQGRAAQRQGDPHLWFGLGRQRRPPRRATRSSRRAPPTFAPARQSRRSRRAPRRRLCQASRARAVDAAARAAAKPCHGFSSTGRSSPGSSRSSSCWPASAAIFSLPIEQYPDVAPPQVNIRASYPGASAETLENSVTQIIEQQLTGIDGLLYFSSSSSSRGSVGISAIFAKGTDPDIAQVQVQNQVSAGDLATCRSRFSSRASGSPSRIPTSC